MNHHSIPSSMAADNKLFLSDRDKSNIIPTRALGPLFTRLLILSQEGRVSHFNEKRDVNPYAMPVRPPFDIDSDATRDLMLADYPTFDTDNSSTTSLQNNLIYINNLSNLDTWDQHHPSLVSQSESKHTDYSYLFK